MHDLAMVRIRLSRQLIFCLMSNNLYQDIREFYDASSELWESIWGEHMHHGYYGVDGKKQIDRRQAQIDLIEELHQNGFVFNNDIPIVKCKAFEDNNGALEMAKIHKLRPRTKHINVKYHHFRQAVNDGRITLHKIDTKEQQADIFTKPLDEATFEHIRKLLIGW